MLRHADRVGGLLRQKRRITEWREIDPHRAAKPAADARRQLGGQAGLAAAAGAREGQQTRARGQTRELAELAIAADKARQMDRKGRRHNAATIRAACKSVNQRWVTPR